MQNTTDKDFSASIDKLRETFYALGVSPVEKISDDFMKRMEAQEVNKKMIRPNNSKENTASA
ncbi:MAG: hypothetical protein PHE89_00685 [Alphaproteobacteria bacterium]|nr:hypothetical protein [Alphaproteobacteria bacterium]